MNFFQQGIPLGRWFGITVVIHWTFLLYAAYLLFSLPHANAQDFQVNILWLVLLFGTVLAHEFGHALSCKAMGGTAIHIVLWPLGGIAFIKPPGNAWAWLVTTVCGPLVNAVLWPLFWVICYRLGISTEDGAQLYFATHTGLQVWVAIACLLMLQINKMLLLFNLIPSYPMDGGRILQEIVWLTVGYAQSLRIAGAVGVITGAGFIVLGVSGKTVTLPQLDFHLTGTTTLAVIGFLCATRSWQIFQLAGKLQPSQQS
jgi:Zn-dependent protease